MTSGRPTSWSTSSTKHDRVIDQVPRSVMRREHLRHRAVYVVVTTSSDEIVVHRRAEWKDVYPGAWDLCFGGVLAAGEDWADAARRELAEEAGIEGELRALGRSGAFDEGGMHVVGRVFAVAHDGPYPVPRRRGGRGRRRAAGRSRALPRRRPTAPTPSPSPSPAPRPPDLSEAEVRLSPLVPTAVVRLWLDDPGIDDRPRPGCSTSTTLRGAVESRRRRHRHRRLHRPLRPAGRQAARRRLLPRRPRPPAPTPATTCSRVDMEMEPVAGLRVRQLGGRLRRRPPRPRPRHAADVLVARPHRLGALRRRAPTPAETTVTPRCRWRLDRS